MSQLYDDDLAFIHAEGFGDPQPVPWPRWSRSCRPEVLGESSTWVGAAWASALLGARFETIAIEPSGALLERARKAAPAGAPLLDARGWKAGPDWAVLFTNREDVERSQLTREIETFRDVGSGTYRRRSEVHHVRSFDRDAVTSWLEQAGFEVETATTYGSFELARRRVAFYATRPRPRVP